MRAAFSLFQLSNVESEPALRAGKRPFTGEEWAIIQARCTPLQIQRYLRSLPYNWENTMRTFRGVVRHGRANCIEAALTAAAIMEQHGYPPWLLDLESVDYLDHVLFLFHTNGRWGTIAKSRDVGLHGRKPVFRSIGQLVMSYIDTYVDGSGRIRAYGVASLDELTRTDWRLSERNVWAVEKALIRMPHTPIRTSDRRHERVLKKFLNFKSGHPDTPFLDYDNRDQWL